jgi:hypothetical protein
MLAALAIAGCGPSTQPTATPTNAAPAAPVLAGGPVESIDLHANLCAAFDLEQVVAAIGSPLVRSNVADSGSCAWSTSAYQLQMSVTSVSLVSVKFTAGHYREIGGSPCRGHEGFTHYDPTLALAVCTIGKSLLAVWIGRGNSDVVKDQELYVASLIQVAVESLTG